MNDALWKMQCQDFDAKLNLHSSMSTQTVVPRHGANEKLSEKKNGTTDTETHLFIRLTWNEDAF